MGVKTTHSTLQQTFIYRNSLESFAPIQKKNEKKERDTKRQKNARFESLWLLLMIFLRLLCICNVFEKFSNHFIVIDNV